MGFLDRATQKYVISPLADYLVNKAKSEPNYFGAAANGKPVLRETLPYNGYSTNKAKPNSEIGYKALRRFSVQYDVARAAINRRKRQLNVLEWSIVPMYDDDNVDQRLIRDVKDQFSMIGGYRVRFREFLDLIVEDLLVLDAVALYKRPSLGGKLHSVQVLDATTIELRVDETGGTPEPPETAYKQVIDGKTMAKFTADEMYYEMMNPRTSTPYGLSPIESLVLGISTALKSEVYNLHMLTEGNIPEGLFTVPETWGADQIARFQEMFDAMLAGDSRATSKLKFMPPGKYEPTMKPEDMRYKELQEWLMKKTCMLFEIQPQELGFTDTVNKATGEVQQEIGIRSGLVPLAHFIEEIFTDILRYDMGYEQYKFKFLGIDEEDAKEAAEVAEIQIRSGQKTVDEVRASRGEQPIGVDKPFVIGTPVFIDAESQAKNQVAPAQPATPPANDANETDDTNKAADSHIALVTEMRTFRKYATSRIKAGKSLRKFESEVLPAAVCDEMNRRLEKAKTVDAVKSIFSEYMQDYQIKFLAEVQTLSKSLNKVINDD